MLKFSRNGIVRIFEIWKWYQRFNYIELRGRRSGWWNVRFKLVQSSPNTISNSFFRQWSRLILVKQSLKIIFKNKTISTIRTLLTFRLALSVKGMLAFGIFITHGIACYVAIDLVWNKYITNDIKNGQHKLLWEYVLRTVIVLITCKKHFDELIQVYLLEITFSISKRYCFISD